MLETTAGRYYARELVPAHMAEQDKEEISSNEGGYTSLDEMDGLSDSASTRPSLSRPTTPSDLPPLPARSGSSSKPWPHTHSQLHNRTLSDPHADTPYAVAQKAVLLLGLIPGSLTHARACLESARDEARRLAEITPSALNVTGPGAGAGSGDGGGPKVGRRRMDRARKALSVAMPLQLARPANADAAAGKGVPAVILGIEGGEQEEARRERRRKVADGVLHWQNEVKRLEGVQQREMMGFAGESGLGTVGGGVRRRMTKSGRR